MTGLCEVGKYLKSKEIIKYTKYIRERIKQGEDTHVFLYVAHGGMQFEDRNEDRYLEFNVQELPSGKGIGFRMFIDRNGRDFNTLDFMDVNKAIEKWNELF